MNRQPAVAPKRQWLGLSLAALGVVYGDIGTSPLYAFRLCFADRGGLAVTPANILGVLSLVVWSLFVLIGFKYVTLVLRADNRGEGGILALMALVRQVTAKTGRGATAVLLLGVFGAALLYGDALITPAISVLSAVEGVNVATTAFAPYVLPLSLGVLIALFLLQRHGTHAVGSVFGPVMCLWFLTLAVLGLAQVLQAPRVLAALNPAYAVGLFVTQPWPAFVTLGAVFLVLTGGEALYADLGHFGKAPIRLGWYALVLPALTLNYFGQGAWLLGHLPRPALDNLFYRCAPAWALYPLVVLATVATVIASQAVISGAFSVTRQAVQLGLCPRLRIFHTSDATVGQVYLPTINWLMLLGTVALVLGFRQSDRLGGAYGVAVATTMLLTTLLLFWIMRRRWQWRLGVILLVCGPLLILDLLFFAANLLKLGDGGWVPLTLGLLVSVLMTTWYRGRELVGRVFAAEGLPLQDFIAEVAAQRPVRVPGVAIFLTGNPTSVPRTLLHNFKHNKILHERIVLLTVQNEDVPRVPAADRTTQESLAQGFSRLVVRYGFSEDPDLPAVLRELAPRQPELSPLAVTYFLGRETLLITRRPGMPVWRKRLFAFLSRNAHDASHFFRLPPTRVIEVGIQVEF